MPKFTLISVIRLKYVGLDVLVITLQECLCDSLHTMQAGIDSLHVVEAACEKIYHFDATSFAFSVFDVLLLKDKQMAYELLQFLEITLFLLCLFTLLKVPGCDLKSWQDQLWMHVSSHCEISHIWVSQIQKFSKPAKFTCVLCYM